MKPGDKPNAYFSRDDPSAIEGSKFPFDRAGSTEFGGSRPHSRSPPGFRHSTGKNEWETPLRRPGCQVPGCTRHHTQQRDANMRSAVLEFWSDESGFLVSAELVIIATILVLGMIVGLSSVQTAMVFQLNSLGRAFGSLNQSYFIPSFFGCKGTRTAGSFFNQFNSFNAACFVVTTGGFGGGFVGYGGFADSTLGIGPSTIPAPTVAPQVPCPSGTLPCPTSGAAASPCPDADCPPGSSTAISPSLGGPPGAWSQPGSPVPPAPPAPAGNSYP